MEGGGRRGWEEGRKGGGGERREGRVEGVGGEKGGEGWEEGRKGGGRWE